MRPVRGSDRDAGLPKSSKIALHCTDSGTESVRDNRSWNLAELMNSVEGMTSSVAKPEPITAFFACYTGYLTAGDLDGLASIYNYPALAVTAAGCLAVTEPQQTTDFFAQGQTFYRSHDIQGVRARDIVTDVEVPGI
jgi:hypothetical protein